MNKKILSLSIFKQEDKILLGLKKRGFGSGLWNGFGGKMRENESIESSAKREFKEESGLEVLALEKFGIINFSFENLTEILEVHVYLIKSVSGEITETDEMLPAWFDIKEIPYNKMWPDDIHWLPLLIEGKKFGAVFHFDKPSDANYQSKIIRKSVVPIEDF